MPPADVDVAFTVDALPVLHESPRPIPIPTVVAQLCGLATMELLAAAVPPPACAGPTF